MDGLPAAVFGDIPSQAVSTTDRKQFVDHFRRSRDYVVRRTASASDPSAVTDAKNMALIRFRTIVFLLLWALGTRFLASAVTPTVNPIRPRANQSANSLLNALLVTRRLNPFLNPFLNRRNTHRSICTSRHVEAAGQESIADTSHAESLLGRQRDQVLLLFGS